MNEAMRNLLNRRSIRKYDSRQVPDELLDAVLEAGIYAPSGMNTQGVRLVAVRDSETVAYLSRLNAAVMGATHDPFYGAPCVVIVLADPEIYGGWVEDGALAMGNLMNAAHALGVDSCWIHRAREVFDLPEPESGDELILELITTCTGGRTSHARVNWYFEDGMLELVSG